MIFDIVSFIYGAYCVTYIIGIYFFYLLYNYEFVGFPRTISVD